MSLRQQGIQADGARIDHEKRNGEVRRSLLIYVRADVQNSKSEAPFGSLRRWTICPYPRKQQTS